MGMKHILPIATLLGILSVLIYLIVSTGNPYTREIEEMRREGDELDARIATARSDADCEMQAYEFVIGQMLEAMNPLPEFELYDRLDLPNAIEEDLDRMLDTAKGLLTAAADGAIYLMVCLRELEDRGQRTTDRTYLEVLGVVGGEDK